MEPFVVHSKDLFFWSVVFIRFVVLCSGTGHAYPPYVCQYISVSNPSFYHLSFFFRYRHGFRVMFPSYMKVLAIVFRCYRDSYYDYSTRSYVRLFRAVAPLGDSVCVFILLPPPGFLVLQFETVNSFSVHQLELST